MVRRRHAQLELSQVVLFGLVLPEPEKLMEPWLREADTVMMALRRRWRHRVPRMVATDRGFYSGSGERRLVEMGVRCPVLPKPGHRTRNRVAHERQRSFKQGRMARGRRGPYIPLEKHLRDEA